MGQKLLALIQALAGLALPLAAVAQQASVQPVRITFGKPEAADFEAKNFVADSAAPAVVLYDYGTARFALDNSRFKFDSERTTRIKILKTAGFEYATVEVPLYHVGANEEKLVGLRAFTYNMVGGKLERVKLEMSQTFTEERSARVSIRKFTLPNVRVGSVIDITYGITSAFWDELRPWTFQRDIPTRWSECHLLLPEYFDYKMLMQGYQPLAMQQREDVSAQYVLQQGGHFTTGNGQPGATAETLNAKAVDYRWAMKDVPALHEEPYMTTPNDYVAAISFELAGTRMPNQGYHTYLGNWLGIQKELYTNDRFGRQLDRGADFLAASVKPLVARYPDPAQRAAAVRELVMQAVQYNSTNAYLTTGSLHQAYDVHRGNAADVNLLLLGALRQAGLAVQPVLLSTRAHGRVNEHSPQLGQFNYVAVLLPLPDHHDLLLDATEPLLPAGVLPPRCLNQLGRVLPQEADGEGAWISLTPSERATEYHDVKMALDAQGNLSGQIHHEQGGYAALAARTKLGELGEKKYITELATSHPGWEISKYEFANQHAPTKNLALDYEWKQPASTEGVATELYIKPMQYFGEAENPFKHTDRLFPVDLGMAQQEVVRVTLTLPPGYTAELPQPATVALPDNGGRFLFQAVSPAPGTVLLTSMLTLSKPIYSAEEYAALREFYRLVLAKQAEALVVKKGS